MSELTEQSPFHFEREYDLDYEEYAAIMKREWKRPHWTRTSFSLVFGVILLFWSYTFVLGVLLLGMLGITILKPSLLEMSRTHFRTRPNLHGPILYGVSDSGLWLRSKGTELSCVWGNLNWWGGNETWLQLHPHGMQPLHFRVDDLKDAGVYSDVLEKINSTGAKRWGRS